MLKNKPTLAIRGVDTAEKASWLSCSLSPAAPLGDLRSCIESFQFESKRDGGIFYAEDVCFLLLGAYVRLVGKGAALNALRRPFQVT